MNQQMKLMIMVVANSTMVYFPSRGMRVFLIVLEDFFFFSRFTSVQPFGL